MNINVDKATVENQRRLLSDAVTDGWVTDFDLDSSEVFIERWQGDKHRTFRHTFTMTDTSVEISEDSTEVIRTTDFKDVEKSLEVPVTESKLMAILDKFFGGSKRQVNVIKQFGDDSEMYCIEPLYTAPGETDGHGDVMDLEGLTGMVDSINKANDEGRLQNGLFHKHKTNVWSLEKAWINPTECMIGDTLVPEGQPIAKTVFNNERAFQMRVDGDISGLSIGARATGTVDLTKDLADIQARPTAVRKLLGVHFDWDHPELTYTSPSQGGAASLKNESYEISKAKKATIKDLDKEQTLILKEIDEEFVSLEKHLGVDDNQTPSSSAEAKVGEDNQVTKGTNMTDVTREEFEALQKALAVSEAVNALSGYGFETDINKAVAGAIAALDDEGKEAVTKAFDALVARTEAEVEKAKAATPEEESELSKALSKEAGEGGEAEEPVEKSLAERARDAQDKMKGDK
jgi:hypothetical protein